MAEQNTGYPMMSQVTYQGQTATIVKKINRPGEQWNYKLKVGDDPKEVGPIPHDQLTPIVKAAE